MSHQASHNLLRLLFLVVYRDVHPYEQCKGPEAYLHCIIFSSREKISSLIEANKVVVLSGETGCGKTTQVKATKSR